MLFVTVLKIENTKNRFHQLVARKTKCTAVQTEWELAFYGRTRTNRALTNTLWAERDTRLMAWPANLDCSRQKSTINRSSEIRWQAEIPTVKEHKCNRHFWGWGITQWTETEARSTDHFHVFPCNHSPARRLKRASQGILSLKQFLSSFKVPLGGLLSPHLFFLGWVLQFFCHSRISHKKSLRPSVIAFPKCSVQFGHKWT